MSGRAAEVARVSAAALVLTIAIAAPVLRAPSERMFGRETVGRHHDPFTVMEQFSRPVAIGLYSQPLTDIPGAWLARLSGPVAAYNWLVLLSFPLAAAAAYLLARHLSLSPGGAAIAAIAFAFSPFHLAHAAYHPHIAQIQWLPLYFLALWRCLDRTSRSSIGLLGLATAGVTLSNFYGGLIAAVLTPAAIAAYWFFRSRSEPGSGRRLAVTIASLAVIAIAGLAYARYAAPAVFVNREAFGFARDDLFRYNAKWWSYLVPPVASPLFGETADRVWTHAGVDVGLLEQQVSLGWGLLALGLAAILTRNRHEPRRSVAPVLAVVAAVAVLCSLSPERTVGSLTFVRPSALLYEIVPMFRSYARFGVVVQLMVAVMAGIGAERLWRMDTMRARVVCAALLILATAEYAVWPPALWRDVLPTEAHRWVARQPDRVQVLDCAALTPSSASVQWLTGYRVSLETGWFDDCTEPNFADKLSAAGYTHLLVRHGTSEGRWFAGRAVPEGLQSAGRFGDSDIFAVSAPAPPVYTARMTAFYEREGNDAWTWRWMGSRASWCVINRSDHPVVAAVDVEMTAFHGTRRLALLLDGSQVQTLMVEERRGVNRIGPLVLSPGEHELVFHPSDPPAVANDFLNNGDRRPLSVALGSWRWDVERAHP